jgi:hypothetical protein
MNKTGSISKGGMYTALSLILIYMANVSPTSKLSFLAVASAVIPLSILSTTIKNSIIVYVATSTLSLLLGLRGAAVTYALFFGLYGFVKYYIERLRKLPLEWILKITFFNACFLLIYFLYKLLVLHMPEVRLPVYLLLIVLQIAFVVYDYAMSLIITYISRRVIKQ